MSLTNRVCTFFLAALGIILAIYSLVFYGVTRDHIHDQFSGEMRGVLNSLIAAAEVEETEVKWQPLEHSIDIGVHDEFGEVQWVVRGDDGLIVEQSRSADRDFLSRTERLADSGGITPNTAATMARVDNWVLMGQQVSAPHPLRIQREFDEFDQLSVAVGRSTIPRDAILFRLTLLVTLLPLLAWSIAAVLGRWVIRKALRPVSAMAKQAQQITGTDFQSRLTHGDSGDELTELGTAFNRLLDRQQTAFEQQRRFAGDAAHELRTPITVLLGQIDVTLRRRRSESEYESNLELLRSETQSLQEIVESLLFLARSDAESDPPPLRSVNVTRWLEHQSMTWSANTRSQDLCIENQLVDPTMVRATTALLGRVVDNLVFNAMKYSKAGSPVIVRVSLEDKEVLFQVLDSGPGIAADDLPQLFDAFFRSSEARRRGIAGSGLGLAIASRIAATLGGKLECESTLGHGSCFTLRLPVAIET
ncbi:Sensor kinase CusS [Rubripirellula lacrimiformis]|uniref:histidine kinase n=1 Tax=Rubripirellula lacrimiformis TaxID=1930273 RepID=A0A517N4N0_9BACT|nr:HAMP domain-containing sensor histidine kinase [Rubripirellula lacrimiformis]QDT02082.1 Sensor kinase CusS [Rubripirellula lacrimiformis]